MNYDGTCFFVFFLLRKIGCIKCYNIYEVQEYVLGTLYVGTQIYVFYTYFSSRGTAETLDRGALNKRPSLFHAFRFIVLLADVVFAETEKWSSQRRYGESYRRDSREFPRNIPEFLTRGDRAAGHVATLKSRARVRVARVPRFEHGKGKNIIWNSSFDGRKKLGAQLNGVHFIRPCEQIFNLKTNVYSRDVSLIEIRL